MKEKRAIVKLVFGCIDDVVSTTESFHKSIAENVKGTSRSGFAERGKRKRVYDTIKAVNSKVGELISGFTK
mgnify:CR=1 FL=1